jgi:EpsI family protein
VGNQKDKQILILTGLLLLTCIMVYWPTSTVVVQKPLALQTLFGPVQGYELLGNLTLEKEIVSFLDLDDYTQTRYRKDGKKVELFIGYYFSLAKVSAAHSPLVCFPGQGWTINQPSRHNLRLERTVIEYEELIATLGDHQELVLYWYQAADKSVPEIYRNKINAIVNNLTGKKQEHAFVRISVPLGGSTVSEARKIAVDFITAFHPVFLGYIQSGL